MSLSSPIQHLTSSTLRAWVWRNVNHKTYINQNKICWIYWDRVCHCYTIDVAPFIVVVKKNCWTWSCTYNTYLLRVFSETNSIRFLTVMKWALYVKYWKYNFQSNKITIIQPRLAYTWVVFGAIMSLPLSAPAFNRKQNDNDDTSSIDNVHEEFHIGISTIMELKHLSAHASVDIYIYIYIYIHIYACVCVCVCNEGKLAWSSNE